jgi:diguanylate cyclase (GGDEF)-like protein/PAS domain S-box-containing protein
MAEAIRLVTGDARRTDPLLDSLRLAAAEAGTAQVAVVLSSSGTPEVRWANAAALTLLALEPDEVLGHPVEALGRAIPGERPEWTTVVAEALASPAELGSPQWRGAMISTAYCAVSPVQVRITPAKNLGWIIGLRPVIDAEQQAEEARRESEHRFSALAEHAPVGIILSEAGVRLGYVNNRFAEITGKDHATLLSTHWLDCVHSEDLSSLLEGLDEVLDGYPVEVTVRLNPIADSQRWVQFRLSPVTTPRRAAGFIATVEDITARRAWEAQLAYQAGHDALTGLVNRRRLTETLDQVLTSRRRRDRDAAVLFCDLDEFKQINDTLGHDAGDRVLIEVGRRLTAAARDHDVVARIAGDEFVVLIREVNDLADAEAAAARQLTALEGPIRVAGEAIQITSSIGLALAGDFDTASGLLQAADRGMYEAKRSGRGLYRVTRSAQTSTAKPR